MPNTTDDPTTGGSPDQDAQRAARIRALKEGRGWTWARVAQEMGVKLETAQSWGSPTKAVKPNWPHLARMAELFDVTPTWIETGQDGTAEPADPVATARHDIDQLRGRLTRLEEQVRFIQSNTDRITQLEGATGRIVELVEQQAAALMPLASGLLQAAADRRASEGTPPAGRERRKSGGRRRNDPEPG